MALPKFSTGNTAMRSTPTGLASAFERADTSEPSTARRASRSPEAMAPVDIGGHLPQPEETPLSFSVVSAILSAVPAMTSAAEVAEEDSSPPDALQIVGNAGERHGHGGGPCSASDASPGATFAS